TSGHNSISHTHSQKGGIHCARSASFGNKPIFPSPSFIIPGAKQFGNCVVANCTTRIHFLIRASHSKPFCQFLFNHANSLVLTQNLILCTSAHFFLFSNLGTFIFSRTLLIACVQAIKSIQISLCGAHSSRRQSCQQMEPTIRQPNSSVKSQGAQIDWPPRTGQLSNANRANFLFDRANHL